MSFKRCVLLASFAASSLAAAASAQGPGGPPGGPGGPGGFGPGTFLGPQIVKAADSDKDGRVSPDEAAKAAGELVRSADLKKAGGIDADALAKAINKAFPPPDFGGGGDGPPPGDFGPGTFLGPQIFAAADADKDGKLTPEEAAKAAERFIGELDGDKKGSIDAATLGSGINRRMGPPPGMGGPGGPMGQERKLLKEFDKDGDGRLSAEERKAARASIKAPAGGGRRFGPPGMFGTDEKGKPGPKVARSDAASHAGKPLYAPEVLRTLFLEFDGKAGNPRWRRSTTRTWRFPRPSPLMAERIKTSASTSEGLPRFSPWPKDRRGR